MTRIPNRFALDEVLLATSAAAIAVAVAVVVGSRRCRRLYGGGDNGALVAI